MSFGENVKRIRMERNMKQCELAEKVGITQSMICQIEKGIRIPSVLIGKAIADVLQCNVEKLTSEEGGT